MGIPKRFTDLVGTKQEFIGCLFSQKKEFKEPTEFDVLDIRWGSGQIADLSDGELTPLHPTVDLLLKREGMKRAQWAREFAVPEIDLREEEV